MKLGANEIEEEHEDNSANLGDYSADWGNYKSRVPKRNFKHAKRRSWPEKQSSNLVKWDGRNTTHQKRSRLPIISCLVVIIFAILCYQMNPYLISVISKYVPHPVSSYVFGEQCNSAWTTRNTTRLKQSLQDNVFGQHIAQKLIMSVLSRRWNQRDDDTSSKKPLVMSFHGWTGSGKNYVSKFIAESLFAKGMRSKFVHLFVSTLHFHDDSKVVEYRSQLQDWVRGNVSICQESLFIIDEIDKMPAGVLDGLKPFMDFHSNVDGIDFRKAIFILLSNTGGREITKRTMDFWEEGKKRESMTYFDLEGLVSKGAFNEQGGLQHASIIDRSLIDVYVPFLPLEQSHVRQCVEKELQDRNVEKTRIGSSFVDQVVSELSFWPLETKVFASAGCKRVGQKVDELLYEALNWN